MVVAVTIRVFNPKTTVNWIEVCFFTTKEKRMTEGGVGRRYSYSGFVANTQAKQRKTFGARLRLTMAGDI